MSAANYMMAPVGVENGSAEAKYSQASHSVRSGGLLHGEMQLEKDGLTNGAERHSPAGVSPYEHSDVPPAKKQKKTKGRVKIKMEFIDNKLRRYTTFSKRKTGIMKKAYELSTLTGTQVMLLVASETGHVYTFATRKLQPMITSDSGKALIQTCLNSPDLPGENQSRRSPDQRMCATGFEETELSYSVSEEDEKDPPRNPMFTVTVPGAGADVQGGGSSSSSGLSLAGTGHTYPMTTYLPTTTIPSGMKHSPPAHSSSAHAQSAHTASFTTLLANGTSLATGGLPPGFVQVTQAQTPVQLQALPSHQGSSLLSMNFASADLSAQTAVRQGSLERNGGDTCPPRLPHQSAAAVPGAPRQQLLTTILPAVSQHQQQLATAQPANAVAMLASTQPQTLSSTNASTFSGPFMYQTPQGVVYATGAGNMTGIPEALLLNYQAAHQNAAQTAAGGGQPTPAYPITALSMLPQGVALSQQQLPQGTVLSAETKHKVATSRTHST